jgi:MFS family permease
VPTAEPALRDTRTRTPRRAVALVGYLFTVVMAGGTLPSPLYPYYVRRLGLTPLLVTVVFATYAVGVLVALLLLGGVSDRVGRRPVLAAAVAVAAVSTAVFLLWPTLPGLLLGRVLSGLSVGLTTGTATAALAELHPDRRAATTLATVANMGGLGLGPVVSGLLAAALPGPTVVPFLAFLVLLLPVLGLRVVPETVPRRDGGLRQAVRPQRLALPRTGRGTFGAAAVAGATAFALLGLFTSLTADLLATTVGDPGPAVVGLTVALVFAAAVAGQLGVARARPDRAALLGLALLPVAAVLVAVALATTSLSLFVVAAALGGVGIGAAFQSALVRVGRLAGATDRAAVTSAFFVLTYLGITLPVVGLGELTTATSPTTGALGLAVLVAVLSLAAAAATVRWPTPAEAGSPQRV